MRLSMLMLLSLAGCGQKPADVTPDETGDADTATELDGDGDGFALADDCDDGDASIHPDAAEICDGVDQNCDDVVDNDATDGTLWYSDGDGDGYGVEDDALTACEAPAGYADASGDCDDADAAFNPGANEDDCTDPADYNCDGGTGFVDGDGDGAAACEDCDDADAAINASAAEICDDVDNNCDAVIDDDATDAGTWYLDGDLDGYGDDAAATIVTCDMPAGYAAAGGDCDDADTAFRPGADEADCADPADYNCDGSTGYDNADGDAWAACEDCDDADADVRPDATELCNGIDDDCDATIDEDSAADVSTFYLDADSDTYGDAAAPYRACAAPVGYVADATDCDDGDGAVSPGATELCDDVDNDCDAEVDEDSAADAGAWYMDGDSDAWGDSSAGLTACEQPAGYVALDGDCDDLEAATNPGAAETCDGLDNDCDGTTDGAGSTDAYTWYFDDDGDGFGDAALAYTECDAAEGYVDDATDCDDLDAATHPGAAEYCGGADENCDGAVDEETAADAPLWFFDGDVDGYGDAATSLAACTLPAGYVGTGDDCDDLTYAVNPGAIEYCNTIDDDCDAVTDGPDAADASLYFADVDVDGYGDPDASEAACAMPAGYVEDSADCDDASALAYPGATEYCDALDNDCDTVTDESDAVDAATWFLDGDVDGYGLTASATVACHQPSGYVAIDADCDDGAAGVNPGATETCNTIDDNCDGLADEPSASDATVWYADVDVDTYGDSAASEIACTAPTGHVAMGGDCDDGASAVNPGAAEVCEDDVDNDCSGGTTDCELDGTASVATADHAWYGAAASEYVGSSLGMGDVNGDGTDDVLVGSYGYDFSSGTQNIGRVYAYYGDTGTGTETASGSTADAHFSGVAAGDSLGYTGTAVRDIDADGDDELLLGSHLHNYASGSAFTDAGAAYLFSGSPTLASLTTASAAAMFYTTVANDYTGWAVADAGDFDDDGRNDLLVGSHRREVGTLTDAGVAALFYGTSASGSHDVTADYDVLLSGDTAYGYLGYAFDGVGDVDGDGVGDVVIGAYGGDSETGAAYLILGGATGALSTSDADGTVTGAASGDRLGISVAGLGDTDGDGLLDWALGADSTDAGGSAAGTVYVYSGAVSGSVSASAAAVVITGYTAGDYVGRKVEGGDVNGDGLGDLLISATAADYSASGAGEVYLYYAPLTSGSVAGADARLRGVAGNDALGYSLGASGDVDSDGYDDFVIGSIAYDYASTSNTGGAWLFHGSGI